MVVTLKFTFVKLSWTQINYQSINQKNMEGVITATYKGMEKDKSKYYFTGLEKKVWHHLETNLALVQYQGPQYDTADIS